MNGWGNYIAELIAIKVCETNVRFLLFPDSNENLAKNISKEERNSQKKLVQTDTDLQPNTFAFSDRFSLTFEL
jgi:hypothetical protein